MAAGPWDKYASTAATADGSGAPSSGQPWLKYQSGGAAAPAKFGGQAAGTAESGSDYVGGAALNALQGLSLFNVADEATAGLGAGFAYLGSGGDSQKAGEEYDRTLDQYRKIQGQFAERHPTQAIAYQLGGSIPTVLATGGAALAAAPATVGARLATAGVIGAGYGAAAGFGAGEGGLGNRAVSAVEGIPVGAALGVAGEGAATAFGSAWRALVGSSRGRPAPLLDENGQPTEAARQIAQQAGVDLNAVPGDVIQRLQAVQDRGGAGGVAGTDTMMRAQMQPVPIDDVTLGNATGDMGQLARERAIYRNAGGSGSDAAQAMRDSYIRRDQQLAANLDAYQSQLGGGDISSGQGGQAVSNLVNAMNDAEKARMNVNYKTARDLADQARDSALPAAPIDESQFNRADPNVEPLIPGAMDEVNFARGKDLPLKQAQAAGIIRTIQNAGGIRTLNPDGSATHAAGDLNAIFGSRGMPPGLVNNSSGRGVPLDRMREALEQEGWFPNHEPGTSTVTDLLNLIADRARHPLETPAGRGPSNAEMSSRLRDQQEGLGITPEMTPQQAALRLAESRVKGNPDEPVPSTLRPGDDGAGKADLEDSGYIQESAPDGGPVAATGFAGERGSQFLSNVFGDLRADHSLQDIPKTASKIRDMTREFMDEGAVRVSTAFDTLRRLTKVQSNGGEEAVAAGTAKAAIEREIDAGLERGLLSGDERVIDAYRKARSEYREYASIFKGKDVISQLVEKDRNNNGRLKLDPEQAANVIAGWGKMGFVKKPQLAVDVAKLRDLIGAKSPEWNQLRQEFFIRIARAARGISTPNGSSFSGANLAKAWESFVGENEPLARVLFSATERRDFGNFVNLARRLTTVEPGNFAPSISSFQVSKLLRRGAANLLRVVPGIDLIIDHLVEGGARRAASKEASQAIRGRLPQPGEAPDVRPTVLTPILAAQPITYQLGSQRQPLALPPPR